MKVIQTLLKDKLLATGFVLLALSLFIFCIPFAVPAIDNTGLFIINYLISIGYFVVLLFSKRLKKGREGLHPFILFLVLFLIGAYSLNREMVVFEDSATWFSCLLVLVCINYLAFSFRQYCPAWLQHGMYFILGTGFVTFLYLSCYLLPLYLPGAAMGVALGISLHSFVPLLLCIYTIVLLRKTTEQRKHYRISFYAGIVTVFIFTGVFIARWNAIVHTMNTAYNNGIAEDNDGLPAFVGVAATISPDWITEKAMQSGLVYTVPQGNWDDFFWRMPARNFGEERKHDPLVMMAALFTGTPKLSDDERIKILESLYSSRHKAQERFWSGKHLVTDNIHTAVRVWPSLHLAYTEKLITVSNNLPRSNPWNREEAIYTFHLPEGSVVSALSLWIKGREEKGIVTTTEKADSAYTSIVGYEQRDPSVVHWQEGNTVTVRVFPVVAGESRVFRLGITSPLDKQADSLTYENIYFDGPGAAAADEEIKMDFSSQPKNLVTEAGLQPVNNLSFRHSGKYNPDWKITFKEEGLAGNAFSFDGVTYSLAAYTPQRADADIHNIYLDINNSWTKTDFEEVYDAVKQKNVFVYDHELVRLTETNKDELFTSLSRLQFSLFPLYAVSDASGSVLVSKSSGVSPNMHDLQDSRFIGNTKEYLRKNTRIKLFNIGTELSPYLKSLKEFRAFRYEHGNAALLKELVALNHFAADMEDDHNIVIDNAGLSITASDQVLASTAPDHLMRLFTYNHLMQKAGARLYADSSLSTNLAGEAAKAGIVTPVSSLVVLETKQDYDRFNIKQSVNSLQNASLKSKGAVPEPHEWALLAVVLSALLYVKYGTAKKKISLS